MSLSTNRSINQSISQSTSATTLTCKVTLWNDEPWCKSQVFSESGPVHTTSSPLHSYLRRRRRGRWSHTFAFLSRLGSVRLLSFLWLWRGVRFWEKAITRFRSQHKINWYQKKNITVDRKNFAVKTISRSRPIAKIKHAKIKFTWWWSMSKHTREVHINVQLTTTVSNTWLFCYLVIDQTLGTLQVLVHIVTINR